MLITARDKVMKDIRLLISLGDGYDRMVSESKGKNALSSAISARKEGYLMLELVVLDMADDILSTISDDQLIEIVNFIQKCEQINPPATNRD